MPLTEFQRGVCRILAAKRVAAGEGYVAGGVALNEWIQAPRVSRDIDLFHDAKEAVLASWASDRETLSESGYDVFPLREFPSFVEAEVRRGPDAVMLQWVHDSAYRFFPLMEHADFGLVLHPLDLAINKALALIGRVEVRDWVDIISCHRRLQPLGCLVWAAAGKDPGLNPQFILEQAGRSAHYTKEEYASLAFQGTAPSAMELMGIWRDMLQESAEMIEVLPEDHIGCCMLKENGHPFAGTVEDLRVQLDQKHIRFHPGAVHGAWPVIAR